MRALWRRGRRSRLTAVTWGSALTSALALIGLLVIGGVPGSGGLTLRAAPSDSYNQMTGIGSTASAVTVNWTNGLLDSTNQPITGSSGTELNQNADRAAGSGSLSFMDADFAKLSVTVSQTQNITQQGITVSWAGAPASTSGNPYGDFMQMMECYGDSASGPSPEGCEYGSPGMLGTQIPNNGIGSRIGALCTADAAPSVSSPPSSLAGGGPASGCDPNEPTTETPTHCDSTTGSPTTCAAGDYSVPFMPADDPTNPLYQAGSSGTGTGALFNQFTTNEVQAAYTGSDGTGTHQFETLTATQAPGLGCGEAESNGQTRNCWLVIVPRGNYATNGFHVSPAVPLYTSPLSVDNWAQRIQIHLGYAPLAANCPPTVLPDAMVGTQLAYRAVTSWQSALNQAAHCSKVYSYTATFESATTDQLASPGGGNAGLGFTTIPIGSEATRDGLQPTTLPAILYAPVAVTATDFGFNINGSTGPVTTPVKLTPSLLARALTQVYKPDLPDGNPGPAWAQGNPGSWTFDPSFSALNPGIEDIPGAPDFPLITGDHSGINQQIWQWVQSDPATASWLDGGADPNNPLTPDPDYVSLKLGQSPAPDNFSEAYTGTLTCAQAAANIDQCGGSPDLTNPASTSCPVPAGDTANTQSKACDVLNTEDLLPVESNFDQAASAVVSAVDPSNTSQWSSSNVAADGSNGWWGKVGTELPGHTFMWAVNDMPDLAAYGLISAALCDPTGAICNQPSTDSVTTALNSATADSAGLLQVNPATVPAGGYPLTQVVYAAVPTSQSAQALSDYASFIAYAAGQGQSAGTAPGDLPPGYLPLPASLQTQAQSVVAQLQALAVGASSSQSPTTSPSATTGGGSAKSGGTATGGGTTTGGSSLGGTGTAGSGSLTNLGSSTTGGGTTTASSLTSGGSGTTTGGATTSGTSAAGTTTPASPAATCTPAPAVSTPAAATPSVSSTAAATPAPTAATAGSGCAASSPQAFDVLPPSAQAAANGTTQSTVVGSIGGVLVIVLIIGAAGAAAGLLLRFGRLPGRGRSRSRTGSS